MRVAQFIDGQFSRLRQLPKDWKRILNFAKLTEAEWNEAGFYRVVEPTLTATQKKGAGYLDGNVYTWYVVEKTQAELDAEAEQELNSDVSQQAIDQRRADGVQGFDRIKAIIERKYRNGEITGQQALDANEYFHPLIVDLNFGSWYIVKGILDNTTPPAKYQNLFNTIKGKVDNYIQSNY